MRTGNGAAQCWLTGAAAKKYFDVVIVDSLTIEDSVKKVINMSNEDKEKLANNAYLQFKQVNIIFSLTLFNHRVLAFFLF